MRRWIASIGLTLVLAFVSGCSGGGSGGQQGGSDPNETTILPTPNPNTAATQEGFSETAAATAEAGETVAPPATETAAP